MSDLICDYCGEEMIYDGARVFPGYWICPTCGATDYKGYDTYGTPTYGMTVFEKEQDE